MTPGRVPLAMNATAFARSWSAAGLCRFRGLGVVKSGRGLPHSKTLARPREIPWLGASWLWRFARPCSPPMGRWLWSGVLS